MLCQASFYANQSAPRAGLDTGHLTYLNAEPDTKRGEGSKSGRLNVSLFLHDPKGVSEK